MSAERTIPGARILVVDRLFCSGSKTGYFYAMKSARVVRRMQRVACNGHTNGWAYFEFGTGSGSSIFMFLYHMKSNTASAAVYF
jgi:hypothetical protein